MSIKNRIIYSSILLLTLFLIMGVVNWIGNKSVMRKTDISYLLEKEIMHVQGIFRGINEFIIDEGEPLSIELTESHLAGFDEIHNTYNALNISNIKSGIYIYALYRNGVLIYSDKVFI